jgi:hypothetical protein
LSTLDTTELAEQVSGPVLGPDDEGYDAARALYNGLFDRRPTRGLGRRTSSSTMAIARVVWSSR